jgi:hypothetical protein
MIAVTGACDRGHSALDTGIQSNESNDLEAKDGESGTQLRRAWGEGKEEKSDGLFPFGDGSGKVDEIEFREVLNLIDEGRQRGFEFLQGGILLGSGSGGDEVTQVADALFQGGGHNSVRLAEIVEFRPTGLRVYFGKMT